MSGRRHRSNKISAGRARIRSDPSLTGFHTRNKPRHTRCIRLGATECPGNWCCAVAVWLLGCCPRDRIRAGATGGSGRAGVRQSAANRLVPNPSVLSDPSGIENASRMPPLGTNSPAPPVTYGPIGSPSPRVATPYVGVGASHRITAPVRAKSKKYRPRGRGEVSTFTGICRGC